VAHVLLSNATWVHGASKNSFVINWRSNCGRRAWQLLPSPRSRTIADFATTSGPRLGRRHQTSRKGSGVGRTGNSPGISSTRCRRSPRQRIMSATRDRAATYQNQRQPTVCCSPSDRTSLSRGSGVICWTTRMRPTNSVELWRRTARTLRTLRPLRTPRTLRTSRTPRTLRTSRTRRTFCACPSLTP